jgi:hypothetical protein
MNLPSAARLRANLAVNIRRVPFSRISSLPTHGSLVTFRRNRAGVLRTGRTMHHPVSWCRTSERHFAADLGRVGSLMVWVDAANGTWSAFVLSTQRSGLLAAAATQAAAALRLARAELEEGLRRIETLAPARHGAGARISPPPERPG